MGLRYIVDKEGQKNDIIFINKAIRPKPSLVCDLYAKTVINLG